MQSTMDMIKETLHDNGYVTELYYCYASKDPYKLIVTPPECGGMAEVLEFRTETAAERRIKDVSAYIPLALPDDNRAQIELYELLNGDQYAFMHAPNAFDLQKYENKGQLRFAIFVNLATHEGIYVGTDEVCVMDDTGIKTPSNNKHLIAWFWSLAEILKARAEAVA